MKIDLGKQIVKKQKITGVPTEDFNIYSNSGELLNALVINWYVNTNELSPESLVKYINSKGLYEAYTEEEYLKLKK